MHVVTFYSFKGGVGRTLALANVGVQLAQTGRRVLLVDFDLEAPGLHTFDSLQPKTPQAGLLEFVDDFVRSNVAPDIRDYMYEAVGIGQRGGRLWVMPAGRCDRAYQSKLAKLDWQALYAQQDGYLLFEDLKAQWRTSFEPDYVLIDSRTGHTDVQGICTRQLPDAVVVLFFPNKQNLDGLEGVIADVRAEEAPPRNKKTKLHFVMSNVPDLDDEEEILKQRQAEFRAQLKFTSFTTIHRYDSLTLLNQAIFTRERPRSRLAKEYSKLCDMIVQDNLEDREGCLRFLERVLRPSRRILAASASEEQARTYDRIYELHQNDGEVLLSLGIARMREGEMEHALSLFEQADRSPSLPASLRPMLLVERADLRIRKGGSEGVKEALLQALSLPQAEPSIITRAVRLLRQVAPTELGKLGASPALRVLEFPAKLRVISELSWSRPGQAAVATLLEAMMEDASISVQQANAVRHELSLAYISLGRFPEATRILQEPAEDPSGTEIASRFNFAMAKWGLTGKPEPALFKRVLELAKPVVEGERRANYRQCIAVATWAAGSPDRAKLELQAARQALSRTEFPELSCWRYLIVPPQDFLADCDQVQEMIQGSPAQPLFMRPPIDSQES